MTNQTENRQAFINRLQGHFSDEDIAQIMFAYDLSKEAHRTQTRQQGGRYFEHPRAGCIILMDELSLYDKELIISFLFHDVGEDTPMLGNSKTSYDLFVQTAKFRLTTLFGGAVADVVIRLTKPEIDEIRFHSKEELYAYYIEELQKSEDAILLKAVDRLHNLRSLPANRVEWIKKQLNETQSVYMPIFSSVQGERKAYANVLVSKIKSQMITLQASL